MDSGEWAATTNYSLCMPEVTHSEIVGVYSLIVQQHLGFDHRATGYICQWILALIRKSLRSSDYLSFFQVSYN